MGVQLSKRLDDRLLGEHMVVGILGVLLVFLLVLVDKLSGDWLVGLLGI